MSQQERWAGCRWRPPGLAVSVSGPGGGITVQRSGGGGGGQGRKATGYHRPAMAEWPWARPWPSLNLAAKIRGWVPGPGCLEGSTSVACEPVGRGMGE